jgi:hypothetical protein
VWFHLGGQEYLRLRLHLPATPERRSEEHYTSEASATEKDNGLVQSHGAFDSKQQIAAFLATGRQQRTVLAVKAFEDRSAQQIRKRVEHNRTHSKRAERKTRTRYLFRRGASGEVGRSPRAESGALREGDIARVGDMARSRSAALFASILLTRGDSGRSLLTPGLETRSLFSVDAMASPAAATTAPAAAAVATATAAAEGGAAGSTLAEDAVEREEAEEEAGTGPKVTLEVASLGFSNWGLGDWLQAPSVVMPPTRKLITLEVVFWIECTGCITSVSQIRSGASRSTSGRVL